MLLHRIQVFDQALSADGTEAFDLPVNPLSVLLLCLRPLNETGTLTAYARYMSIVDALTAIRVVWRGASVFSMSGRDCAALNYHRYGIVPMEANPDDANNERRAVVLPVVLGRFPYDKSSCLPRTTRGELTLEIDTDIADTGYDGLRFSAESIELLTAKPSRVERKVTVSQTFGATGNNDVFLPTAHLLRGVLAFGTSDFDGASPTPTLGRMSLHVDGSEVGYQSTDFEVAMTISQLLGRQPFGHSAHTHRVDATAANTTEETTGPINVGASDGLESYAYLDLDPWRDDSFSLDVSKASNAFLRCDAEAADAARVIPIEAMKV